MELLGGRLGIGQSLGPLLGPYFWSTGLIDTNCFHLTLSFFPPEWQTSRDVPSFTLNIRGDFTLVSRKVCHSALFWDGSNARPNAHLRTVPLPLARHVQLLQPCR